MDFIAEAGAGTRPQDVKTDGNIGAPKALQPGHGNTGVSRRILRLSWDNGKENGNYYNGVYKVL